MCPGLCRCCRRQRRTNQREKRQGPPGCQTRLWRRAPRGPRTGRRAPWRGAWPGVGVVGGWAEGWRGAGHAARGGQEGAAGATAAPSIAPIHHAALGGGGAPPSRLQPPTPPPIGRNSASSPHLVPIVQNCHAVPVIQQFGRQVQAEKGVAAAFGVGDEHRVGARRGGARAAGAGGRRRRQAAGGREGGFHGRGERGRVTEMRVLRVLQFPPLPRPRPSPPAAPP